MCLCTYLHWLPFVVSETLDSNRHISALPLLRQLNSQTVTVNPFMALDSALVAVTNRQRPKYYTLDYLFL